MRALGVQSPARRFWLGPILSLFVALTVTSSLRAEEDDLTIGDWYQLAVERGGVTRSYEGTLIQATDHWVVLHDLRREATRQGVPYLMDLPGAGKWFSRPSTKQTSIDCWLPIEAVSIQAHRNTANPREPKSLDADEPPIRRAYLVEMMAGGKIVKVQRDLLKVSGDTLLLGPTNASATARETVNRRDVVSLVFLQIEQSKEK
jgi:hypothetical protein